MESAEERWNQLITTKRLGVSRREDAASYRTTYQKDFDRLIFSAAFRRLQDKTQVFPLAQTDYVRTRLTHSLEVSSVCRSLGTMLGEHLVSTYHFEQPITPSSIGAILAAAALAHDIGNPPFGHAGEETIRRFFLAHPIGQEGLLEVNQTERNDFYRFEGNAQAFRLLTRLQNRDNSGGLQLSLPVLASLIKYPCSSNFSACNNIAYKKFNYFQAERELFAEFANEAALLPYKREEGVWHRHPLAYLLEAADDICYSLVDIEDAYRLKLLKGDEVIDFYRNIADHHGGLPRRFAKIAREKDQIEYLRAITIGYLVDEVMALFIKHEREILAGSYTEALLENIPSAKAITAIKDYAYEHVYVSQPVLEVGIAGFKVLETLLEAFISAVTAEARGVGSSKTRMLVNFLPDQFLGKGRRVDEDPYLRLLKITDFISGMTDRYAVKVFNMISGVDLKG